MRGGKGLVRCQLRGDFVLIWFQATGLWQLCTTRSEVLSTREAVWRLDDTNRLNHCPRRAEGTFSSVCFFWPDGNDVRSEVTEGGEFLKPSPVATELPHDRGRLKELGAAKESALTTCLAG